jgi:hypothetical protein
MNDKTVFPSDAADKVLVRMPNGMRDRLKEEAKANNRTMNAEIVARLSRSFQDDSIVTSTQDNTVLLRTLADFVVLRHNHPEVMASMEKSMVKMALAVRQADDDTKLIEVAGPWLHEYVLGLVDSVSKVTEILGPGWGKDVLEVKPSSKKTGA